MHPTHDARRNGRSIRNAKALIYLKKTGVGCRVGEKATAGLIFEVHHLFRAFPVRFQCDVKFWRRRIWKSVGALFGRPVVVTRLRMTEEPEYGPAMQALNERQRKFVLAMIETPGCTHAEAARIAGYSDVADGAKVRGHYCAHNPAVQAAIREEAGKRLNSASLLAANVLVGILADDEVPAKERLKAAGMLLDRTGFAAVQKIDVTRKDESGAAIVDQIKRLAEKLSLPVERLLAKPAAPVVDGEFSEVKE